MAKTDPKPRRRIAKASEIPVPTEATPQAINEFSDWWEEYGDDIDPQLWGKPGPEVEARLRAHKP